MIVGTIERLTGREVAINGDFDLALSFNPTLVAEDVTVSNAEWAGDQPMVEVARAEISFALWPLLRHGALQVEQLDLIGPRVRLEKAEDGRGIRRRAGSGAAAGCGEMRLPIAPMSGEGVQALMTRLFAAARCGQAAQGRHAQGGLGTNRDFGSAHRGFAREGSGWGTRIRT